MTYNPESGPFLLPICFVVSMLAMGIGLWLRKKTKRLLRIGKETTGETIESRHRSTVDAKGTSYALVRFFTEEGKEVVYESMLGVPWAGRKTGKRVPIIYNPDNPEEARIRSFLEITMPWLIFFTTGTGMFCFGLFTLRYHLTH